MGGLNELEKKSIINEKINNIYFQGLNHFESKEELINNIKLSLDEEQQKYLNERNLEIYFNNKIDLIWEKITQQKNSLQQVENKYSEILTQLILDHQNEINNLRDSIINDEKIKKQETEIKFASIITLLNDKVTQMEKLAENERKKIEDQNKKSEKILKDEIEMLQKKIKEEKEEEKKKEYNEQLQKIEKSKYVNELFKNQFEKIKATKMIDIKNDFKETEDQFCIKEIKEIFQKSSIREFLIKFLKSEKIVKFAMKYLSRLIDLNHNIIKNVKHLNIILLGPSGVGKSTLISQMLEINIKTGFGCPQTKGIDLYCSDKIEFLRLIDSRGIEKNSVSGVNEVYKTIQNFIQFQIDTKEEDNYIHAIWYCWTGTRLEESEVKILKLLSEEYKLETLPVIIVYTNAVFDEEIEKAKNYIKNTLGLNNEFIDILSLEKKIKINSEEKIIKAKNLDLLREKSIELAKKAVKSSIYTGLIKQIKENIKNQINHLTIKIQKEINEEIKQFMKDINDNSKINDLYSKTKNIILDVLYKYFLLNPESKTENNGKENIILENNEFSFSDSSLNTLNDFILDYFNKAINVYQNCLDKFLDKYSKELSNQISIFQIQLNSQYDNLLANPLTNIDLELILKNEFKNQINKSAETASLKNSFKFLVDILIPEIGNYFIELYDGGMEQKKFIEQAISSIQISFDEIEKKIKEYNESLRKKEEDNINKQQNEDPAPSNTDLDDKDSERKKDIQDLFDDENS